ARCRSTRSSGSPHRFERHSLLHGGRGPRRAGRRTPSSPEGVRVVSGWDDLYREAILDHYRHPRHRGTIEDPDLTYQDAHPLWGDRIGVDVNVRNGVIDEVRFSGQGCAISQAAASMLCERIAGRPVDEAKAVTRADILEMLGVELGPVRVKCATLALKTLKAG